MLTGSSIIGLQGAGRAGAPSAGLLLDRVFLDANVLYSAPYLELAGLARLWSLDDAQMLTSAYAIEEARRNLAMDRPEAVARLMRLLESVSTVDAPQGLKLRASIRLTEGSADLVGSDSREGRLSVDRRRSTFRASLWRADPRRPSAAAGAVSRTPAPA